MREWMIVFLVGVACHASAEVIFEDDFKENLGPGWSWIRQDRAGWRTTSEGLEVRVQPGNMWGPENSAKNVLVRPAPNPGERPIHVSVTVDNRPTEQYEQVDLVWYYSDGHQVKIGQELVDGQLSIVMGREENDRARTIAIIPLMAHRVELRFIVRGNQIEGLFRPEGEPDWRSAGSCDLPVRGEPKIAIQCYQGPKDTERWAKIQNFIITRE